MISWLKIKEDDISDYLGSNSSFDKAIATFALGYTEQNQLDYDVPREAVGKGARHGIRRTVLGCGCYDYARSNFRSHLQPLNPTS